MVLGVKTSETVWPDSRVMCTGELSDRVASELVAERACIVSRGASGCAPKRGMNTGGARGMPRCAWQAQRGSGAHMTVHNGAGVSLGLWGTPKRADPALVGLGAHLGTQESHERRVGRARVSTQG